MPPRQWPRRVGDMLEAIAAIQRYVSDRTYESFSNDPMCVDAVLRQFFIVGEAAANVPDEVRDRHPALPWRNMRAMRNLIGHAYFAVELKVVWSTANQDLDDTAAALRQLLADEGQ